MAYRQLRSIDKRKQENGHRVFRLGENALLADQYQDAIRILDYIIREKGRESPYYYKSHELTLQAKRAHINLENEQNRLDQISDLVDEYLYLADSLGYNRRSEEHTSELQSRGHLVCRLLLEKKKKQHTQKITYDVVRGLQTSC